MLQLPNDFLCTRRNAQQKERALLCASAPEPPPIPPELPGYRSLQTATVIPAENWPQYCLVLCGLRVADTAAPLYAEALDALCGWVASGDYVPTKTP